MTGKGVRQKIRQVRLKVKGAARAGEHPDAQRRSRNLTVGVNSQLRCCGSSNSAEVKSYKLNLHGEYET